MVAGSEGIRALCSHRVHGIAPGRRFSLEQSNHFPLCFKISGPQGKSERTGAKSIYSQQQLFFHTSGTARQNKQGFA